MKRHLIEIANGECKINLGLRLLRSDLVYRLPCFIQFWKFENIIQYCTYTVKCNFIKTTCDIIMSQAIRGQHCDVNKTGVHCRQTEIITKQLAAVFWQCNLVDTINSGWNIHFNIHSFVYITACICCPEIQYLYKALLASSYSKPTNSIVHIAQYLGFSWILNFYKNNLD